MPPVPPGVTAWGRILAKLLGMRMRSIHIPAATVDLVLGDGGLSLSAHGLPGRIVYTPGHSRGSTTVLRDSGEVLVGGLGMNAPPMRFSPGLPTLAEGIEQVKTRWRMRLDDGARAVYPRHGQPFQVEVMRGVVT